MADGDLYDVDGRLHHLAELKGIQWNQLGRSSPEMKVRYRVNAIPHYALISPEGKVIDQWNGYSENYLKKKLKKPSSLKKYGVV